MKRRILLVDDDLAVLLTLKAVLELHGFEVDTASNTAEAFSRMDAGVYHVVITDLRMEKEDAGMEVIGYARKKSYAPATALLTAYPPLNGRWTENPSQPLLVKPVGTKELVRQLEALLVRHEDEKKRRVSNNGSSVTPSPEDRRRAG